MPDVYAIIRDAVLHYLQVVAVYDGLPRELCPHVLGTTNGKPLCLFYQFGGSSRRGLDVLDPDSSWRCLNINELSDVTARKGPWHTSANYSRNPQRCVQVVDVQVLRP